MKEISLSNGGKAIVDDADFAWLNHWRWTRHQMGYACRTGTSGRKILMHRQIMGEPAGLEIDHRNLNKRDNQRENLRIATHAMNGHNRPKQNNNTSGFKGVSWDPSRNKWRASIKGEGRQRSLGRFARIDDAIAAYDAAAKQIAGEFARVNVVEMGVLDGARRSA